MIQPIRYGVTNKDTRPGYDLPPLMFDREEIQALVGRHKLRLVYADEKGTRPLLDG